MINHSYTNAAGQTRSREIQPKVGELNIDPAHPIEVWSFDAGRFADFHNTSRRMFIVTLSGELEIGYKDGSTRRLGPGDVHLEDDVTGEGHTIRVTSSEPRVAVVIPLTQEWPDVPNS